jgi:hypothetical protein
LEELESKVRELSDREAIRSLRFRYHECINGEIFDAIPDLFSEDAVLDFDYLGQAKGRVELKAFFKKVENLLSFVKQFMHNHAIDEQGATSAKGYAYLEAKTISQGEAYFVAGRYDDEYVKEGGEWKFKKMALTPYFTVPFKEGWAQEDRLKMGR